MTLSRIVLILILSFCGTLAAVDYQNDILPIMKAHCWKCHSNEEKVEGGIAFDDLAEMRDVQIGEISVIRPGAPEKSDLLERLKLKPDEEDFMPRKGAALKSREISDIEKWITEGAVIDKANLSEKETARLSELKEAGAKAGGDEFFQWTNLSGKAIEARYAGMEGDSVKIIMKNGRGFVVPLKTLNAESIALAKRLAGQ